MSLDTTVGGSASDSYVSLVEFNAHLAKRHNVDEIAALTDAKKESLLVMACWMLDAAEVDGVKANETQALRWPRFYAEDDEGTIISSTIIPPFVKLAQMELAIWIYQNDDPDISALRDRFDSLALGSLNLDFNPLRTGIPPTVVRLMRGTMLGNGQARIYRS